MITLSLYVRVHILDPAKVAQVREYCLFGRMRWCGTRYTIFKAKHFIVGFSSSVKEYTAHIN